MFGAPSVEGMKFILEVNIDALATETEPELGRILRYWAGNLKHYDLTQPVSEVVSDTAYTPVGEWRIEG